MSTASDWVEQARRLVAGLGQTLAADAGASEGQAGAEHAADCRWCPVCQVAGLVRGERPELAHALADALTAAAGALRTFAAAHEPAATTEDAETPEPESRPEAAVQHIEIA
ncbi:hypothetical protein [Blastococcus sp. SYSU D00820]